MSPASRPLFALVSAALLAGGCATVPIAPPPAPAATRALPATPTLVRFTMALMGTVIAAALPDDAHAEARARLVFEAFVAVDDAMSEWKPGSPLAEVNRQAGVAPVVVPPSLVALVGRALDLARATDGAFDPTWAALWDLWDFNAASPAPPAQEEIARRLAWVDHGAVQFDRARGTLFLPRAGMKLGLGAIAKGYALDLAAEGLRAAGVDTFVLSAGGQVTVFDAGGRRLDVALRAPRGGPDDRLATLSLLARDAPLSVSTSGDYERFFVVDGVRYHHVVDPRTGRPATAALAATVVGPDGALADGLATALMVRGPPWLPAFATRFPGYEALVVGPGGEVAATPGLCAWVAAPAPSWCAVGAELR